MPKQDRAAAIKKDSAKAKKHAQAEAKGQREAQQAAQEEEAAEAAAAEATSRSGNSGRKGQAPASAFARAGMLGGGGDSDDEPAPAVAPAARSPAAEAPAERPARKKKQQAASGASDMELLLEGERAARRQRVLDRLLRLLLVGLVLDAWRGQGETRETKEPKGKKKGPSSGGRATASDQAWNVRATLGKVDVFGGPFLMLAFTAAMLGARVMEEGYTPDNRSDSDSNLYEVLGVTSDADVLDIRKAYKALALSWHPDKNPNCEACATRFAKISQAYEVLNNPDDRKAYDQRKARKGSLASMASAELTAEDFESRVLRSNEVWIVQVFDPSDSGCGHFHPVWEDVAHSHQHVAKFGRIDATKHKRALDFLPQRVVLMPLVFRFVRGAAHETFLWTGGEEQGSGSFSRWLLDGYPSVQRLETAAEVKSWWAAPSPRVLVTGPHPPPKRGAKALEYLQIPRAAHMWAELTTFASADPKVVKSVLGQDFKPAEGAHWSFTGRANSSTKTASAQDLKEATSALQEVLTAAVRSQVPPITVRNHHQLCGTDSLGEAMRTYCLVLVDLSDDGVAGAVADLRASQSTYSQEVADLKQSGEESEEEAFHIQPVRLATRSSRWPWQPAGAGPGFRALWAEAKRSAAFVIELETRRIASVKVTNLKELYQQIAYEDIKFGELPEGLSVVRALPDPESPLKKELFALLSSPLSALLIFLLLASVAAVLPELSAPAACGSLGGAFAVLLLVWPWAFRRFFALFWCAAFGSSYECQANL